jgi:Peptide-N-glycosidase F, C terminal/Peptide-N-glycosidase F, N terminal
VNDAGTPNESVTELARFITPYRVGMRWSLDVTGLRPLLSGPVTLRVFIDTWVGPGNAQGAGWLVDAAFDFRAGVPAKEPLAVVRLWDEVAVGYGDPAKPISGSAPTRMVSLPVGTTSVELRSFITGHGQGNAENCAEFCQKTHGFKVGEKTFERLVWRADCATTAAPGQAGTFQYPRAGWCPGAGVLPWTEDVTAAVPSSGETAVSYAITAYENTCRPDAPMCGGCTLGSGCAYNDGSHTAPFFDLSALLIAYR